MPLKRVADGCYLDALFGLVDGGEVEISINIQEGDLSFEGLF